MNRSLKLITAQIANCAGFSISWEIDDVEVSSDFPRFKGKTSVLEALQACANEAGGTLRVVSYRHLAIIKPELIGIYTTKTG